MSLRSQQIKTESLTIGEIPCTLEQIVSRPGPVGATITFHALRGVHTVKQVMAAYALATKRAKAINTEWSDPVEDRSNVGAEHRTGTVNGFTWFADWSSGCAVFLVTGPEVRHREDVRKAIEDLRSHFEGRLKTVPTSLEVIRHTDRRVREFQANQFQE